MKTRIRVKTAKGRKLSSTLWLQRQLNDPLVQKAKKEGYRSRATYKLVDINEKFKILGKGKKLIDLGAAPGGWTQIAVKNGCDVTAIDLKEIEAIPGARIIEGDFLDDEIYEQLKQNYDVILSDMAPPATGHKQTNHLQIMNLVETAYHFAQEFLNNDGVFVAKIFQGGSEQELIKDMRNRFEKVKLFKPESSRKDSNEIYIVAIGFKR
ncbi:MAG: 23S rRNA methyltransferase [Alphaproteobacteria bacterium CG11_big_fil_rev_8_21_14_0_20_44_7]|nr:MAG: 23S rRNA methyltransferase [Alphaproteobacteria bacterium CG11_big_fil_rev_8_21_14_0_20_44_7]